MSTSAELDAAIRRVLPVYKSMAARGDAFASSNLGRIYLEGLGGLSKNEAEAFRWWHDGTQKCGSFAPTFFGWMNANQLNDVASTLYRAYEANEACVISWLALLYWNGTGVEQNLTEALRLLKRAVEKGNRIGMYLLGCAHQDGQLGLTANQTEAIRLYTLAKDEVPEAQSRLEDLQRKVFFKQTAGEMAGEAGIAAVKALIRSLLK